MRTWLGVIVCVFVALGCSSETPREPKGVSGAVEREPEVVEAPAKVEPKPDPEQSRAAAVESLLKTVDELAELHRRHADDCAALAEAIRAFHAEHGAALASVPADVHAQIDGDERLRGRMRGAMELVMSAGMKCREDPAFAAAQGELFGE